VTAPPASGAAPAGDAQDDHLRLGALVALTWRSLRFLRPVRYHLVALFGGFGALALVFVPIGLLLFDVFWTRILAGLPPIAAEVALLGLDPARYGPGAVMGPEERREMLRHWMAVAVASALIATPIALALSYYQIWVLQRVNQGLRLAILDRLQSLSLRFHADSRIGDAIYRMYQDSSMVTRFLEAFVLAPVFTVGRFLLLLAVVVAFDPVLALILLAIWPPLLLIGSRSARPLRRDFRRAREANSELTARIQETIAGIRVIKAYRAERRELARFERESEAAFAAAFTARSRFASYLVWLFWVTGAALIAGGAISAVFTQRGVQTFVAVLGFHVWTLGLWSYFKDRFDDGATQARSLLRTWGRAQDIAVGLDRVFELLDREPEVTDRPDAIDLPAPRAGVRFRDVSFRYDPERSALEGVDLELPVGSVTAVVGPTGAGKTTLLALLLRLYDPDRGAIEIDGVPLARFRVASLRSAVSIALQENLLFAASVRENVAYGATDVSEERLRRAAWVACADEFVERLPRGWDTVLGERGTGLSSGQRQRLSLARAILRDAPILILDEPTASLDAETEATVIARLSEWARGRIVLLVTHRLSTARLADRLVVLQDGRVMETGTPAELLARPEGTYRRLREAECAG
jgi:ABC-type multidrug transport system fused ATPase/permease subunit